MELGDDGTERRVYLTPKVGGFGSILTPFPGLYGSIQTCFSYRVDLWQLLGIKPGAREQLFSTCDYEAHDSMIHFTNPESGSLDTPL